MKSILLCEGETDQIILSYYFQNQYQYNFSSERTNKISNSASIGIKRSYVQRNEVSNEENELVIWAVGGREKLCPAIGLVLNQNKLNTDLFYERIIIVSDKDSLDESSAIWENICEEIEKKKIKINFKEQEWFSGKQKTDFGDTKNIDFLLLNVPYEGEGALETFLLSALKETGKAEKFIALKSEKFVESMVKNKEKIQNKYLHKRRQCTKAPLAVFFAITSPDKVFTEMDEMLRSIHWEKYNTIQTGFKQLNCFSVSISEYSKAKDK